MKPGEGAPVLRAVSWVVLVAVGAVACQADPGRRAAQDEPTLLDSLAPVPARDAVQPSPWMDEGRFAGVCVVDRVVDGDTVVCAGGLRVRLLLIDAPEAAQGDPGSRATRVLHQALPPGDSAFVELDVRERDPYGRLLAHLHDVRGGWVNRDLVRRGFAVPLVIPPNVRRVEAIRAAADSARQEAQGLWASGAFDCLPQDFRAGRCGG